MPEISTTPVDLFTSNDPYHYHVDNRPLEGLEDRVYIVNAQVDVHDEVLTSAMGTTGTLANRINTSLNSDGTIKTSAIDNALHNIASHVDADGFVRMTDAERAKLNLIEAGATNLNIAVETLSTPLLWPEVGNTISMRNSDTISWRYISTGVYADSVLGSTNQVIHRYDQDPIFDSTGVNLINYTVPEEFKSGTLRVFVNGKRITDSVDLLIDGYYYEEVDSSLGTFQLKNTIIEPNVIRIDYDKPI